MMLEVQLEQEITMAGDVYGLEALTSESFRLDALPEPFRSRVNKAEGYYREHPDARQPNREEEETPADLTAPRTNGASGRRR
jgi:hypothetical protein